MANDSSDNGKSEPKRKAVRHKVIDTDGMVRKIARKLIDEEGHLSHLKNCETNIAYLWKHEVKPDADGREWLCKTSIETEHQRLKHGYDATVFVNYDLWNAGKTTDDRRIAELYGSLLAIATKCDANGEPLEDDNGRTVYRKRKPDTELYRETVSRCGLFSKSVRDLARSMENHRQQLLDFDSAEHKSDEAEPAESEGEPVPA